MKKKSPKLTDREKKIIKAAQDAHLQSRIVGLEYAVQANVLNIKDLQKTVNEFFDLIVAEFEKAIGHNFAAPFKAKLVELAAKYDPKPQEPKEAK